MMSLWDALRMNMMISYQELVRTFPRTYSYPINRVSITLSVGMIYLPVVLTIKLCPSINAFLSRRHKRFIDDISDGLNLTL
ncbi:hypothetical protein DA718_10385 [Klebsiella huaxiensis]|nr:hypothetical protein DA718_10385 [Klebsiella huaxiensis]